ncbi:recoverin family protein [Tieghemostelium lacteum]|uniref:Recoverin family protein n=1 Tax=Tieghemostelium lacteum TaxID=361077 RepID=A0A151Z4X8_TIELA|nr:recoverin family protein [Tieghemostelium lacteum]|eukprot:KYQ89023.1 recoverin family protein [Tieghemostelium lacteum]
MGNASSSSKDFKEIAANSRLDHADLKDLLKKFNSMAVNGELNKEKMKKVIDLKYGGTDSAFSNILFNLFDRNNDKTINFQEFCLAYGYLVNRTLDDIVETSFKCLDLNGDGFISKSELRAVVLMNKKMEKYFKVYNKEKPLDQINLLPLEVSNVNKEADELFDQMDVNGDKQISKEEFLQLTASDPVLKQKMSNLLVKDESLDFFSKK